MEDHPLAPRIEAVEKRLDRMESKLDQVVSLEIALREMANISTTFRKEIDKVWDKVDDNNAWRQAHVAAEASEHAAIVRGVQDTADQFKEVTDKVETKVDEWINKAKGIGLILVWSGGLIQALFVGMLTWQFNTLQDVSMHLIKLDTVVQEHIKNSVK